MATDNAEKLDFLRDVVELGNEYLAKFPVGTYKTDVVNAVSLATIELGE
jgi:hypothetical protein